MNLRSLNNDQLHASFKRHAQREREILCEVLLHVVEAHRRQLYLNFGRTSLYAYMTLDLGYSNNCAQRRIDAARLSQDVPDLIDLMRTGEMNLGKVTTVQSAVRQVALDNNEKVPAELKNEVVFEILGKTVAESEVIVAKNFGVQVKEHTKVKHQADESVRLEVTLSKEQWEKLEEMRALLSQSTKSNNWDHVLEYVAEKVIQQKKKVLKKSAANNDAQKATSTTHHNEFVTDPVSAKSKDDTPTNTSDLDRTASNELKEPENCNEFGKSKPCDNLKKPEPSNDVPSTHFKRTAIPAKTLRALYEQQTCCQYVDKKTGLMCQSKWHLQTDHIVPIWAGGDNSLENLQRLCATHNKLRYQKQAGIQRK